MVISSGAAEPVRHQHTTLAWSADYAQLMTTDDSQLIWHYTDGNVLMEILSKNELWASSAAFMNDTSELLSGSIQLRQYFEDMQGSLPADVVKGIAKHIPEAGGTSRQSFILSASSDGDNLTMWRYYGRDQVSFAVGLDKNEPLVPLARHKCDEHPNPPAGYLDDKYDKDENGEIAVYPDGSPIIVDDPDAIGILRSEWKSVIYDPAQQTKIVAETFDKLLKGVEKTISSSQRRVWFFPFRMNESLNVIKNHGFRDELEERIIVLLNPDWKFVFHRSGPYGLVPYIKLTTLAGDNADKDEHRFATAAGKLPIREIRIGPTPYSAEAMASLKQLLDFHGLHDVKVSFSEIPFRQ